ncbi:E3 ubiquitin-protein ligase RNF31-like, partial [Conger conger]|uniref:E3 ubiquitin-protein ligase RNF31-like n=1 Tax=Conger conger TaxID=82655 RepID=UPI002A5A1122
IPEPRVALEIPCKFSAPSGPEVSPQPVSIAEWRCKTCTVINTGSSVLCSVCERPRLAHPQPVDEAPTPPALPVPGTPENQWRCQQCTFINAARDAACEMCTLPRSGDANPQPPAPVPPVAPVTPVTPVTPVAPVAPVAPWQNSMRKEGLKLIQHIRDGEQKGVSPEEVYAALCVSRGSDVSPCDWLDSELPHLLDEICAMAASVQPQGELQDPADQGRDVHLSRAEAKQSWVAAGGDKEKAVWILLRNRHAK